jgi:hypothetical protein
MKTLFKIEMLCIIILAAACSSPLDKEFDRETAEADFARIVKMGKIDSADAYIMSHFMVEHQLIGAQILELDATYRDILEESKRFWEKSNGVNKDDEKETKTADTSGLLKDLKVSILPLGNIQQSQWSHGIKYKLTIENTSGKGIKAVKGNFAFIDPFGDRVYSIEYKFLDPIEVEEKIERDVILRIQNIASPQQMLEYGKTNPFTIIWEPVSILFN